MACFGGDGLGRVMRVLAEEYRGRGGGVPDLFLWDVGAEGEDAKAGVDIGQGQGQGHRQRKREVRFVEVKSENDRLSDTQRMWIHVLIGAGVRAELCNVVAREVRVVDVG